MVFKCFYCKRRLKYLASIGIEKHEHEEHHYTLYYCDKCGIIYQVETIFYLDFEDKPIRFEDRVKEVGKLNLEALDVYP